MDSLRMYVSLGGGVEVRLIPRSCRGSNFRITVGLRGLAWCRRVGVLCLPREQGTSTTAFHLHDIPTALHRCADIRKRLCLWDESEAPAQLHIDADVKNTAQRILEFEEQLPLERLDLDFFARRQVWRQGLAEAVNYESVLDHLTALQDAISEPVTRILVKQVLTRLHVGGRLLGADLAGHITRMAVPSFDFTLPPPLDGWEYGSLDLAGLRQHAQAEAARIPAMIQTKATQPTSFGKTCGPIGSRV